MKKRLLLFLSLLLLIGGSTLAAFTGLFASTFSALPEDNATSKEDSTEIVYASSQEKLKVELARLEAMVVATEQDFNYSKRIHDAKSEGLAQTSKAAQEAFLQEFNGILVKYYVEWYSIKDNLLSCKAKLEASEDLERVNQKAQELRYRLDALYNYLKEYRYKVENYGNDLPVGEGLITMTTAKAVGETLLLRIEANGDYTVEGATRVGEVEKNGLTYTSYKLTSQQVAIKGKVFFLYCDNNQLTALDVSKNTQLEWLYCENNQLTELDISKNAQLEALSCDYNQLTTLDISKNTQLKVLNCDENQLTTLDVSKNTQLTQILCNNNQLTALDASKNTHLKDLRCHNNQLTALDVSKNTQLEYLYCDENQLTTLDVSKNAKLQLLYCDENQLTTLDVSKNAQLKYFNCDNNQLTALDASKNTHLKDLRCHNNQLTALYVSKNTQLLSLSCFGNAIQGEAMQQLVTSLPQIEDGTFIVFDQEKDKNLITQAQVKIAKEKGWNVLDSYGNSYEGVSEVTPQPEVGEGLITMTTAKAVGDTLLLRMKANGDYTVEGATRVGEVEKNGLTYTIYKLTSQQVAIKGEVTALVGDDNQLTALDVSKNAKLEGLNCYNNQLTALDVSKNTQLQNLDCYNNQLTALDVSKNAELKLLSCSYNQLTALEVSKNAELALLFCDHNQLTALDISKNAELGLLDCSYNQLASLDVSKNVQLGNLDCSYNQLTALDISKNAELGLLDCSYNQLASLDVSKNAQLKELSCYNNQLTALDVSKNAQLKSLGCNNNQLTSLDVSKNAKLQELYCYANAIQGEAMQQLVTSLPQTEDGTFIVFDQEKDKNLITQAQVKIAKEKGWNVLDSYEDSYEGIPDATPQPKVGEGLITMTTAKAVGDTLVLSIEANGDYTVEGATRVGEVKRGNRTYTSYQLTSQQVTIKGEVKSLFCDENMLTSLDISQSTQLQNLLCFNNQLASLDVSKNGQLGSLHCYYNQLTSLDVSKNTQLKFLYCYNNQLTTLDVSKNAPLWHLDCYGNAIQGEAMQQLVASLPQHENGRFIVFDKRTNDKNLITQAQVKVAQEKGWRVLDSRFNAYEGIPDATPQPKVDEGLITMTTAKAVGDSILLYVKAKGGYVVEGATRVGEVEKNGHTYTIYKLTSQQVAIKGEVTTLVCDENQLTALDVSKNAELKMLSCSYNQLTALDVSKNAELQELYCNNNQLTALDVNKNTLLQYLDCAYNQLTTLDVSKNTLLQYLDCAYNQFTTLDVSKNTLLQNLLSNNNQLTTLDVSKNTQLYSLNCDNNQLTALDVSKNAELKTLSCSYNQLASLDVSKNAELQELYCYANAIQGEAMQQLVTSLPQTEDGTFIVFGREKDKNLITQAQVKIAKEKGWNVLDSYGNSYEAIPDATPQPKVGEGLITMTTAKAVGDTLVLSIEANGDYIVEGATRGEELQAGDLTYISYKLTSQQVAIKGEVTTLNCFNNGLTALDVSKNEKLEQLECFSNQLVALDVSKNEKLERLDCSGNQLTSLDVSQNPMLMSLLCYYNRIQGEAMNQLVTSLPKSRGKFTVVSKDGFDENFITQAQVKMAEEKGWHVNTNGIGNDRISFTTSKAVGKTVTFFVELDDAAEGFRVVGGKRLEIKQVGEEQLYRYVCEVTEPNQTFTIEGNISGLYARQNSIVSVEGSTYVGARRMTSGGIGTLSAQADEVLKASSHLRVLDVSGNELKTLSIAQLPNLEVVRCDNNQLSQLNVSAQAKLKELNCANNHIRGKEMDALIASFPKDAEAKGKFIVVSATEDAEKGNHISVEQVAKAEETGWKPLLTHKTKDADAQDKPQIADETAEPFKGMETTNGIQANEDAAAQEALSVYDLSGRRIDARHTKGVVIVKRGNRTTKQVVR